MDWKDRRSLFVYVLLVAGIIFFPDCSGNNSSNFSILHPARPTRIIHRPLAFEANEGQTDPRYSFIARGAGFNLFLGGSTSLVDLVGADGRLHSIQVTLSGSNSSAIPQGLEELPGIVNYFRGNDPRQWHTNIHTFNRVQFRDVYPGINLVYYGNTDHLENDFVLAPGADPKSIRLAFVGGDHVTVDPSGDLLVSTSAGELHWKKPVLYQPGDTQSHVEGRYVVHNGSVGFEVGPYDPKRPLVIDPVILAWATYYGGQGDEAGRQIATDAAGNIYVSGWSTSFFPTTPGSLQPVLAGPASSSPVATGDAAVLKLNASGTAVLYATYIGGTNDDSALGIAVDAAGNAYLTGATQSTDFPTTPGAFQTKYGGASSNNNPTFGDAFVAKLSPDGSKLLYSTYVGGTESDHGMGIAVDSAGNAYVCGTTASKNFPVTTGAAGSFYHGGDTGYPMPTGDVFVLKINPTGTQLVYSTYLGGGGDEIGTAIAIDSNGNAYVTGATNSQNFPITPGAYQTHYGGSGGQPMALMGIAQGDAFVTKVNATGTAFIYSTYLGGTADDNATSIAVDNLGQAYVTGSTLSLNFPTTTGALQTTYGRTGGTQLVYTGDAFVTKLKADGSGAVYSTYLGGNADDIGTAIIADSAGNAYVAGATSSPNFPVSPDATQPKLAGSGGQPFTALADAFVTKLNPAGTAVLFSTYLGGEGDDIAMGLAVDASGNILLSGNTASAKFPVTAGAAQTRYGGARGGQLWPQGDIFVARIGTPIVLPIAVTVAPTTATLTANQTQQFTATLTNTSNTAVTWTIQPAGAGSISTSGLYTAPALIASTQTVTITATSVADNTKSASATVTLNPTPPVVTAANVVNDASLSGGPVTPGMVVKITVANFPQASPLQGTPDPNSGVLGTTLGNAQVLFDNNPAPIVSVANGSVVAIVPYEVAGQPATQLQVVYQGLTSAAVAVPVTDVSPALFAADSSGAGQGLIFNSDSSPNSDANPAPIESTVTIIGTGEGQTTPPGTDGLVPGGSPPQPNQPVSVTIEGVPASVVSYGGAPNMPAGYFAVTVTIPDGVDTGDLPVVLTVGSASSSNNITIAVSPVAASDSSSARSPAHGPRRPVKAPK